MNNLDKIQGINRVKITVRTSRLGFITPEAKGC